LKSPVASRVRGRAETLHDGGAEAAEAVADLRAQVNGRVQHHEVGRPVAVHVGDVERHGQGIGQDERRAQDRLLGRGRPGSAAQTSVQTRRREGAGHRGSPEGAAGTIKARRARLIRQP
jgi:hypothetical protein